ncbi:MAG: NAD(P)H-dependent glycerol-3-phosphate dehydrogenase [Firmicutes bacterium]|nr:NAD(P)H-dependent glycerol-3-phosphate dehydrogenase [Bacillota bacterium]
MGKKISVLGSGSWGTALAVMLSKKGYEITLWSWFEEESKKLAKAKENLAFLPGVLIPNNVECIWDLEKCIDKAEFIVMAVPSHAVREMSKKIKPFVRKDQIIVNVAKGLEQGSLLRLSAVIGQEIPQAKAAVLSGPSHAEEVAKDIPTTGVAAAEEREIAEKVQDVFMNPKYRVYTNPDMVGVELGGALKNVIALCAGVTDGLGFGDNTKAALMTRGIAEIARLGIAVGAKVETFAGLSGIGDLIVTCTSMHSRNRRAGILIGQGKSLEEALKEVHMVVEGVTTAKAAYHLAAENNVEMPIVNEAYRVLFENKNPKNAVVDLMMRTKTHEMEEIVMKKYEW